MARVTASPRHRVHPPPGLDWTIARVLLDITEAQALARTAVNIAGPAWKGTP